MAKNITIARLNTLVTANAAQFTKELDKAQAVAKTRGKGINDALGMIGVGLSGAALFTWGKSIVDLGGKITDLAAAADLPADVLQRLSVLAGNAGVSIEDVAKASEKLRDGLQSAAETGGGPFYEALRKLNLTVEGLQALKPEEQWEIIARRVSEASDKQAAYNAVSEIFGTKLGPKLRSTLEELAKGMENVKAQTQGAIFDKEQLDYLDAFGDRVAVLTRRLQVLTVQLFDSRKGFQDMWNTIKGGEGKIPKGDIREKGPTLLKGGNAEIWNAVNSIDPLSGKIKKPTDSLEKKMMEAFDPDKSFLDGLKKQKDLDSKVNNALDLFFSDMDRKSAENQRRTSMQLPAGSLNTPTDQLSRLGLLTGAVPPEQKKQTTLLTNINQSLIQINDNTRKMKNQATFSE